MCKRWPLLLVVRQGTPGRAVADAFGGLAIHVGIAC
jgi:hypothetical protein